MTNQNQLFEAMGYIDDDIAERAIDSVVQKKRKKPITLIAIAAAAAVLSMIVGFAAKNDAFEISFHGNNISQRGFTATLTDQQFTIPKEFDPMRDEYHNIRGFVDMLPGEVYEKVGLTMLTSENFTETKDVKMRRSFASGEKHSWEPMIHTGGMAEDLELEIEYCLYNKNIDTNVWVRATYIADNERFVWRGANFGLADDDADIVKLNDGGLAMVSDDTAAFVLDGAYYHLTFDDYQNKEIATLDNMKQVLADFGIYTPAE